MRLLHAGPDRQRDGAARARRRSRRASRSTRRWPATSAAAAPIRRSSARSCAPRVAHDGPLRPHPEGDGGALRGRLGARRRGRRRRELDGRRRARRSSGKPAPRHDGDARGPPGRVRYTVDVRLAGMLHAAVLRSPVAHGRVRSLDLEAALAVAGRAGGDRARERAVADDARRRSSRPSRRTPASRSPSSRPTRSRRRAAGVRALALDIEVLAHVVDPQEAVNEQRFIGEPTDDARGDAEAALAAAEVTVELELETPAQLQTPLEPHAAVASWDGDELTAWVSTQGMFSAPRGARGRASGCARTTSGCVTEFVGGGFGAKQGAGFEALAAAELARDHRPAGAARQRPARRAARRRPPRRHAADRSGSARRRDGTLTAIEADAVRRDGPGRLGVPRRSSPPARSTAAPTCARSRSPPRRTCAPRTRSGRRA